MPQRKTGTERIVSAIQGVLITAVCSWIFYDSLWGMAWVMFIVPFWCWLMERQRREKRRGRIQQECKELLQMLSASLQAGYSVETAFCEAERELETIYGRESLLLSELRKMNRLVKVSRPVEDAFLALAEGTGLDEMVSLGYIFQQAKRTGGDYGRIMQDTARKLEEKLRTTQEIAAMTAQKQLELRIMCLMPVLILVYVRCTSFDFIAPLYHNLAGVLVMTVCMIFYGSMILLGDRLVQINV